MKVAEVELEGPLDLRGQIADAVLPGPIEPVTLLAVWFAVGTIARWRGEVHTDNLTRDRDRELLAGCLLDADGIYSSIVCSDAGQLALYLARGQVARSRRNDLV